MIFIKKIIIIGSASFLILLSCGSNSSQEANKKNKFGNYWYQGKAEITSYHLQQARYGQIHDGKAVTIFVTEDFSRSKHVKLDHPQKNPRDAIKVLKLNLFKKFNTGIYPYSMMNSVFTPVHYNDHTHTIKVTASIQEWCGQVFMQMNEVDKKYNVQQFSYFESEGDRKYEVDKVLLEDEIWNLIRLAPDKLPEGKIDIITGTLPARLLHFDVAKVKARASKTKENDMVHYKLEFDNPKRELVIHYKADFPHEITGWEESYESGFRNKEWLTTKAVKDTTIMIDYWTKNKNKHEFLRRELGLD
jgi:hypothetical protein